MFSTFLIMRVFRKRSQSSGELKVAQCNTFSRRKRIYTEEKAKVGYIIASIPYSAYIYFAPGRYEEEDDLHQDGLKNTTISLATYCN